MDDQEKKESRLEVKDEALMAQLEKRKKALSLPVAPQPAPDTERSAGAQDQAAPDKQGIELDDEMEDWESFAPGEPQELPAVTGTGKRRRKGQTEEAQKNTEPFYIKIPPSLNARVEKFIANGGIGKVQDKTSLGIAALELYFEKVEKTQDKIRRLLEREMSRG